MAYCLGIIGSPLRQSWQCAATQVFAIDNCITEGCYHTSNDDPSTKHDLKHGSLFFALLDISGMFFSTFRVICLFHQYNLSVGTARNLVDDVCLEVAWWHEFSAPCQLKNFILSFRVFAYETHQPPQNYQLKDIPLASKCKVCIQAQWPIRLCRYLKNFTVT